MYLGIKYGNMKSQVGMHNDVITAINRWQVEALSMLELTSTFYTVDYQTVLSRVSMRFMQNTIFTIYASVRPSNAGIVSKRMDVSSQIFLTI